MKIPTAALLTLLAFSAHGADLYKCAGANGRVTYSDKPCVVGKPEEGKIFIRDQKLSDDAPPKPNPPPAGRVPEEGKGPGNPAEPGANHGEPPAGEVGK